MRGHIHPLVADPSAIAGASLALCRHSRCPVVPGWRRRRGDPTSHAGAYDIAQSGSGRMRRDARRWSARPCRRPWAGLIHHSYIARYRRSQQMRTLLVVFVRPLAYALNAACWRRSLEYDSGVSHSMTRVLPPLLATMSGRQQPPGTHMERGRGKPVMSACTLQPLRFNDRACSLTAASCSDWLRLERAAIIDHHTGSEPGFVSLVPMPSCLSSPCQADIAPQRQCLLAHSRASRACVRALPPCSAQKTIRLHRCRCICLPAKCYDGREPHTRRRRPAVRLPCMALKKSTLLS